MSTQWQVTRAQTFIAFIDSWFFGTEFDFHCFLRAISKLSTRRLWACFRGVKSARSQEPFETWSVLPWKIHGAKASQRKSINPEAFWIMPTSGGWHGVWRLWRRAGSYGVLPRMPKRDSVDGVVGVLDIAGMAQDFWSKFTAKRACPNTNESTCLQFASEKKMNYN
jgi:hypothetical protein